MGVDRTWDPFFKLGNTGNFGFADADALWKDIQSNMHTFIAQHGDTASEFNPVEYISRPKWSDVEDYLKSNIDLPTLKSRTGC
jgi:hypothetical protein